ncbi:ExbD/TolR family protein [Xylophilus sp.]|uniref:ExbD/TolR family protein n=1 Tax=Xylophilus sp. TaxID=2653893 RepID=UPI0013B7787C|nr:biopolymer transporter ExbD [Xylophilus sp.]KAF1047666.1 MAG: Biopolymer transport protein ExbD [Xylophilus sp.]
MPLPSAAAPSDPQVLVDINTTPLIDVMLVLLIMLIITIPIQLHSVNLNLPTPSPNPPQKPPEVVQLQVQANGSYIWNGEPVANAGELQSRLHAIAVRAEVPELHIKPERDAHYKYVATALAGAQREGLKKLGIVNSAE